MTKKIKFLDYTSLIKKNLLNVIKHALEKASEYGLSDGHHFYITFDTNYSKNKLPEYLRIDYPKNVETFWQGLQEPNGYLGPRGPDRLISPRVRRGLLGPIGLRGPTGDKGLFRDKSDKGDPSV